MPNKRSDTSPASETEEVLFVKNMVCRRCVMAVESILDKQGLAFSKVVPGEIHLPIKTNPKNLDELGESLSRIGLELIDDRISGIIEKIKQMVIRNARNEVEEKEKKMKLSTWLSQHLHLEYTYLSSLFSSIEGRTIENFFSSKG